MPETCRKCFRFYFIEILIDCFGLIILSGRANEPPKKTAYFSLDKSLRRIQKKNIICAHLFIQFILSIFKHLRLIRFNNRQNKPENMLKLIHFFAQFFMSPFVVCRNILEMNCFFFCSNTTADLSENCLFLWNANWLKETAFFNRNPYWQNPFYYRSIDWISRKSKMDLAQLQ